MHRPSISRFVLVSTIVLAASLPPTLSAASAGNPPPAAPGEMRFSTAVCRSVQWLKSRQLADGSFGVGESQAGNASTTADAVYVLALAREDLDGPRWRSEDGKTAIDALAALAPAYVGTDAGQAGKVARAVALAGRDPTSFAGMDLLKVIEQAYDPATGRYHPSFAYRHTVAAEALVRASRPVPGAAVAALQSAQLGDGGWFWAFGAKSSDIDTTGRVLELIAGTLDASDPAAYTKAQEYLAAKQLPEGGWNDGTKAGPANANSTALAIRGLWATGADLGAPGWRKAGGSPLDVLLSFQEQSGAFTYIREAGREESRIMATLDALVALLPFAGDPPYCEYLPLLLRS